jgi:hypothetical protein
MRFAVSIGELQRSFLAGFLEGEASLRIHEQNGGQSLACQMVLNQRDDEQDMLEWLLATTGLGRLRRVAPRLTSRPQISWLVDGQDDCRELLALKAEMAAARRFGAGEPNASRFASSRQLLGYISGFVCAEGCFGISNGRPRFTIHLRQDDEPLLRLLADETGFGKVTCHRPTPPLNPTVTWTVAGRAQLAELRDLLWEGGLTGRKLREMEIWGEAVDELSRAARIGVRPRRDVLESAGERLRALRVYRPCERSELLRLPGRDLRAEAVAALTEWSRASAGKLSATDYMRWRRGGPGVPDRNTIVRQFGSWQRALDAAGLGDRAAISPASVEARRSGGQARREARRHEQRARVIAAVQRFESEHGRLPRALEFFRWRLDSAIDAPTQGSVYRLFPGGWAEVLEGARQVAGATV